MSYNYNPVMTLKTLDLELQLVMKTYDSWYDIYLDNIKKENYDEAKKTLFELNRTNEMVMKLVARGKSVLEKANKDGIVYDKTSVITFEKLNEISKQCEYRQVTLSRDEIDITNLDGKLDISQQNQKSNYIQYIIIIIVGVLVMALTAKTMITKDDSSLDIAILVIVVGLAVYFLITNLIIH